ncbi:hypothetical protein MGAD_00030 [Mycolicibacterium gadium]|uniref:AMP-dependent synthetase/ligase domain-containing protein n=1 Tax=Mycolicibacterium gadium TaxID=1794 RepID=A0A7I7WIK2_MYCGU|nr:hypothetical protein MGAD_00030 [Mycolicibacterium gadium]
MTRLANALSARGIGHGDRVAVLGYNSIELVESWLAALRLGAIAVPVNFRMVADEIAYVLADSGAAAVLADIALAPTVEEACAKLRRWTPSSRSAAIWTTSSPPRTVLSPRSQSRRGARVHHVHVGHDGLSQGAVLTHRNLYLHAFSSIATLGNRDDDDCWMAVAPLFHTAGVSGMLPMFLNGGAVIPPSVRPRRDRRHDRR